MKPEVIALCVSIEAGPDEERTCRRCLCTMAAPALDFEPTALCNSCAQITCVELAAAVRDLISARDAALRDRSAAVKAIDEVNAVLERRGVATADAARRVELLERKVKRLAAQRPVPRKKARR